MTDAYQFQVDGRSRHPVRRHWEDAAQDAVNSGYARWVRGGTAIRLASEQGAVIARLHRGSHP